MFNKYRTNQLILTIVLFGLIYNLSNVSYSSNFESKVYFFLSNLIFLNYLLNAVHQSSHFLLSKKTWLNRVLGHIAAIFSGFTWSHFLATHLEHHKHLGKDDLDPDFSIANSGNFLVIPFLIWQLDWQFFSRKFYLRRDYWKDYIFDRLFQVLIIVLAINAGYWNTLAYYWIIPMWIVGFLYGQYLFYWPHYSNNLEQWSRKQSNFFSKLYIWSIDLCRTFHALHHDKVSGNMAYFPLESYLYLNFIRQYKDFELNVDSHKYIMHKS